MQVRSNWMSLLSWRAFSGNANQMENSIRKLSSGLRINSAADDAAGLAIAQRIRAQYQGLVQAVRNAQDGISLVQTAEGALVEIHSMLQRAFELSVQAGNDTYGQDQKGTIQTEVNQILDEIDRTTDSASFNNRKLFTSSGSATVSKIIYGLRTGWLEQAERLINQQYGLQGDGSTIAVVFEKDGTDDAWVTGDRDPVTGAWKSMQLHINLNRVGTTGGPDGGSGPYFDDRKIARALTVAILGNNTDVNLVDSWFVSGAADFLAGRDEFLKADIAQYGKQNVIDAIDDVLSNNWKDDSRHRSAAYIAVKFLNSILSPFTIKDVMNEVKAGNSLDTALANTLGVNVQDFINLAFKPGASAFIDSLNLDDADVGAIGGGDASAVIPNGGTYSDAPLQKFKLEWPPVDISQEFTLQIGANEGDTLTFTIQELSTYSLGLLGVDLVNKAKEAQISFSSAIRKVTDVRTSLGSVSNRLEHTISANQLNSENHLASMSRIMDLDFAKEMANLSRQQIMVQSSGAMLAQANSARQHVMWLLRGIAPGGGAVAG